MDATNPNAIERISTVWEKDIDGRTAILCLSFDHEQLDLERSVEELVRREGEGRGWGTNVIFLASK